MINIYIALKSTDETWAGGRIRGLYGAMQVVDC